MPFRTSFALLLLAVLSLGLGGCLFDHPLTDYSSTSIDTRLLGVFEFKEADKTKNRDRDVDTSIIHRMAVLPLDANRYVIYYRDFSKKPTQTSRYIGWISRVDSKYYLTFQDDTEGSGTIGKFGFLKFEWEFPGNILFYAPDLKDVDQASSPYQLRVAVRKGLKAGTLFPYEATWWKKIARVWANPGTTEGTTIPPEFEKGTTLSEPGL